MEFEFKHTRLSNGLEIIAEINPYAESICVSYVVLTGARDERPEEYGLSHFLEHMAFKGTPRRTADDVNREFDEIGAIYNAFTSEEVTAFWASVLPEYLERALDLLSDILFPSLREEDFNLEKQVILEEIQMYRDQPISVLFDAAIEAYFTGHPLGHSVLGTEQTVGAMTVEMMRNYHRERYRAGNIVLGAAGKVDWDRLVALVERMTADWPDGRPERVTAPHRPPSLIRVMNDSRVEHGYLLAMCPAPSAGDPRGDVADVLAAAVGHSTGSRLYHELVEPGYADSAELDRQGYLDTGVYLTTLTCAAAAAPENLARVLRVYRDVTESGLTDQEVERMHRKLGSRIVLGAETPAGRLSPLVTEWIYRRCYRSVDDVIGDLHNIDVAAVSAILGQYPLRPTFVMALGPIDEAGLRQAVEDVYGSASVA